MSHRLIGAIVKNMTEFQDVVDIDIRQLAEQAEVGHFEREECLFGHESDRKPAREMLHVLLDGFVKVSRITQAGNGRNKTEEGIISYRQPGEYFSRGVCLLVDWTSVEIPSIKPPHPRQHPPPPPLSLSPPQPP